MWDTIHSAYYSAPHGRAASSALRMHRNTASWLNVHVSLCLLPPLSLGTASIIYCCFSCDWEQLIIFHWYDRITLNNDNIARTCDKYCSNNHKNRRQLQLSRLTFASSIWSVKICTIFFMPFTLGACVRIKIEILSKLPTSPTPARTVCVKRITRGRQINADLHINVDSDRSTPIYINVSTDRCRSIDANLSRCRSLLMPIYWCRSYIEVDRSKPISIDDDIYRCIDRSVPICISADLYRRRCIDADLYWCCDTYRCQ